MNKPVNPEFPILDILQKRWSPRAFATKPVEQNTLNSLFEAARWSASCFNEQPWGYVYAHRAQTEWFAQLLSCLVEFNQSWAKEAAVLIAVVARQNFKLNDKENAHAIYDTGQATAQLVTQAVHESIFVHQMAGFSIENANQVLGLANTHQPICFMALGYLGEVKTLPEDLQKTEVEPRTRNQIDQFVFNQSWPQKD